MTASSLQVRHVPKHKNSTTDTGRLQRKETESTTEPFEVTGRLLLGPRRRWRTFCCSPESSLKAVERKLLLKDLHTTIKLDIDTFVYKLFYFNQWQPSNKTQMKE